jgi:hypothetical protein
MATTLAGVTAALATVDVDVRADLLAATTISTTTPCRRTRWRWPAWVAPVPPPLLVGSGKRKPTDPDGGVDKERRLTDRDAA